MTAILLASGTRRGPDEVAGRIGRFARCGLWAVGVIAAISLAAADTVKVTATVETVPVAHAGDAADDALFWIHPTDAVLSAIIGTDKTDGGGVGVYNLDGTLHQVVADGNFNNLDIRYNFPFGGERIDLIAVTDRTLNAYGIAFYRMDAATRHLANITGTPIDIEEEPYGLALYHSLASGRFYAFVSNRRTEDGKVSQYEITDDGEGGIAGTLVRTFDVGSLTEGMVADDVRARLFVGEEKVAIWKYGAEPDDGDARVLVAATDPNGPLVQDVEGLAIYYRSNGEGYLLASSQGDSSFTAFDLTGDHPPVKTWRIATDDVGGVDGVDQTDGIGVTNVDLGPAFPFGAFLAHDGSNPGGNQNYKVVPWEAIAATGQLTLAIDTGFDPRADRAVAGR
jgi:3-phytase